MVRYFRNIFRRKSFFISVIVVCLFSYKHFVKKSSVTEQKSIIRHKNVVYNTSNSFVMTNLIDQFLHTDNLNERDSLWSLIIKGWSNAFRLYLHATKLTCSSSNALSTFDFIDNHLDEYRQKLLLSNTNFQRHSTAFGIFFEYNLKELRSKDHPVLHNVFLSPCIYFELIVLMMKLQLLLVELNIEYFIGKNTLLGSLRHHDIVPWHSIVEFNLPLNSKTKFLSNINKKYSIVSQEVHGTYINQQQTGFIYKIFIENKPWPQIEIYFYQKNATHIYDSYDNYSNNLMIKIGHLKRTDVFPLQLRPFGPILVNSIINSKAMISMEEINICENLPWNHETDKPTYNKDQRQIPCELLHKSYSFAEIRNSWRRGFCEQTVKTSYVPYNSLSYFRYTCSENRTLQQQ